MSVYRIFAQPTPDCRLKRMLWHGADQSRKLVFRLQPGDIERVQTRGGLIKGLYLDAAKECSQGKGLVVFKEPFCSDHQHMHVAQAVGLLVVFQAGSQSIAEDGIEQGVPELVERNIWGFTLYPSRSGQRPAPLKHSDVEESLLYYDICGHLLNKCDGLRQDWDIKHVSGLTARMPNEVIPRFLKTLANSSAPDFRVFSWLQSQPDGRVGGVIPLMHDRSQNPQPIL